MKMKNVYWEIVVVSFICGIFNIGMFFFGFNQGWGLYWSMFFSGVECGLLGLLIAHSSHIIFKNSHEKRKKKRKSKGENG